MPDLSEVKNYYAERQKTVNISARKLMLIDKVRRWVQGGKVLDYGCGDGFITSCLSRFCTISGCDINSDIALGHFPGIDFFGMEKIGGRYDAILMLDVIEHLEPAEAAETFLRLSENTSSFIFNIPEIRQQEQIVERDVSVTGLLYNMEVMGFKLIFFERWSVSKDERYNFMVLKCQK